MNTGEKGSISLGHNPLMHFTTMDSAVNILNSGEFWFSPMSNANDIYERNIQEKSEKEYFTLCFCITTTGEKLPLWYMYSGIAGQGAAIRFKPSALRDFISSIQSIEGISVDSGNRENLFLDSDFELECSRVIYISKPKGELAMYKDNGKIFREYDPEFDPNIEDKRIPFVKLYPWEYENEFRIVLVLKPEHKGRFRNLAVRMPSLDNIGLQCAYNIKGDIKDTLKAKGLRQDIIDKLNPTRCEVGIEGALMKRIDREAIRLLLEDKDGNKGIINMLRSELENLPQ